MIYSALTFSEAGQLEKSEAGMGFQVVFASGTSKLTSIPTRHGLTLEILVQN
jgi:hypothetical protein